jgi:hypothetical protein
MYSSHISFISHVKKECRKNGIRLLLSKKDILRDGIHTYGGYFDEEKIAISSGSESWIISTLVHEYCHMRQWIDKAPEYTNINMSGDNNSILIMNSWIEGNEYKKSIVNKAISINRDCELNCERRTVDIIKQFNLHLDIDEYCQTANSYILCYNFIKKVRTWNFKESIYDKRITTKMPTDLYTLNYNALPKYYNSLFNKILM